MAGRVIKFHGYRFSGMSRRLKAELTGERRRPAGGANRRGGVAEKPPQLFRRFGKPEALEIRSLNRGEEKKKIACTLRWKKKSKKLRGEEDPKTNRGLLNRNYQAYRGSTSRNFFAR
ncbi:hypothetical protein KM043_002605 [Ampulex compressa]|nr:hypothetical protein KM043_002605 [Ampulex compressa]